MDGGVVTPGRDSGLVFMAPRDAAPNPDAFFALDPPFRICAPDGGLPLAMMPVVPGGTPECPDDKNREGCPCTTPGQMGACWPGLRADRNKGICRDGMARCEPFNEFFGAWGACNGAVLPREGATRGAEACNCFSMGSWIVDNTSPCFSADDSFAISTVFTRTDAGVAASCPAIPGTGPTGPPAQSFSTNRLRVDCAGQVRLCYTIKAGNVMTPQATDCVVAESCTEGWYARPGEIQEMPALPGWLSRASSCIAQFKATGGYSEMSVVGQSIECDPISEAGQRYVFVRTGFCPFICNTEPTRPECQRCGTGGGGNF